MKLQLLQLVRHNAETIEKTTKFPEYILNNFIPISSIHKIEGTKNEHIFKVILGNLNECFVLREDILKYFTL